MSFLGLRMLKNPKKPIYKNCNIFEKYPKGGPFEKNFFSFLNNTEFYYGISKETIRMPFRGLAMMKSTKLVKRGFVLRIRHGVLELWLCQHWPHSSRAAECRGSHITLPTGHQAPATASCFHFSAPND